MTNRLFQYLHRKWMHGVLLLVILATTTCAGVSSHQEAYVRGLPIKPLLESEEIAQLNSDEQSIVKYLATLLFEREKQEAVVRGKKFTYYVKIVGKNPDPTIIANLQDERVKLKPASTGWLRGVGDMVYDPEADFASLYSIHRIDIDGEAAKVKVSFYEGSLSGVGYEYHLIRKNDAWEFVRAKLLWLS